MKPGELRSLQLKSKFKPIDTIFSYEGKRDKKMQRHGLGVSSPSMLESSMDNSGHEKERILAYWRNNGLHGLVLLFSSERATISYYEDNKRLYDVCVMNF